MCHHPLSRYVLLNSADDDVRFNQRGAPTVLLHHFVDVGGGGKADRARRRRCDAPLDRAWAAVYSARRRGGWPNDAADDEQ